MKVVPPMVGLKGLGAREDTQGLSHQLAVAQGLACASDRQQCDQGQCICLPSTPSLGATPATSAATIHALCSAEPVLHAQMSSHSTR